jgi:hypothetical protein
MDKIIISFGVVCTFAGILLINANKPNLSSAILVDFEKNVRPVFIKFYLLGMLPLLLLAFSLLYGTFEILNYFLVLILATIMLDTLTIIKIHLAIKKSKYKNELLKFRNYYILTLSGNIFLVLGFKVYFDNL